MNYYFFCIEFILMVSGLLMLFAPKTLIRLGELFHQRSNSNDILTDYFIFTHRISIGIIFILIALFMVYTAVMMKF